MTDNKYLFEAIPNKNMDTIFDITGNTLMIDVKTDIISDEGYKHFLIAKNITYNTIDIVPMKNKYASTVVDAITDMFHREKIDNITDTKVIICDQGGEFLNKHFYDFCDDAGIKLIPYNLYHHNSTGNIERAIGIVMSIINKYLNDMSIKLGRKYNKWTHLLPEIVDELNRKAEQKYFLTDVIQPPTLKPNILYPLGLKVHVKEQTPVHNLTSNNKMKFRKGDRHYSIKSFTITDYRIRDSRPVMYILDNEYDLAYHFHELMPDRKQ